MSGNPFVWESWIWIWINFWPKTWEGLQSSLSKFVNLTCTPARRCSCSPAWWPRCSPWCSPSCTCRYSSSPSRSPAPSMLNGSDDIYVQWMASTMQFQRETSLCSDEVAVFNWYFLYKPLFSLKCLCFIGLPIWEWTEKLGENPSFFGIFPLF